MKDKKKEYLGDGVYAEFDGFHVILKSGSHDSPDNTIFLYDTIAVEVIKYLKWVFEIED